MKNMLVLLGICALLVAPCFAQGQVTEDATADEAEFLAESTVNGSTGIRLITPRPTSPTAVLHSGATLEQLQAAGGYIRPYTFTGQEVFTSMTYFNRRTGRVGFSNRRYRVSAGAQGFLDASGTRALLVGCGNEGPLEVPIPPVAAVPPQCCTPVAEVAVPPAIEVAQLTPMPPALTLEQVGPPVIPTVTIPKIRFCDTDHDGWWPLYKIPLGMYEKMRCHPGYMILDTALGGAAGYGAYRLWPVKTKVVVEGAKTMPSGGR